MPMQPVYATPGVQLTNSDYASGKQVGFGQGRTAMGRYSACNNVEFLAGFPQKVGGFTTTGLTAASGMIGTIRNLKTWRDSTGKIRLAIATESHLYTWDGSILLDVTPFVQVIAGNATSSSITLFASIGSNVITVLDAFLSGTQSGDYVCFNASVGGITLAGWYPVAGVVAGTGYSITAPYAATSSQTLAANGLNLTYAYQRSPLSTSAPFTTVSGSNIVTVTPGPGLALFQPQLNYGYVSFSGLNAPTVNGVTISGSYLPNWKTESPSSTIITDAGNSTVIDSAGEVFTLVRTVSGIPLMGNDNSQVAVNGVIDSTTSNVLAIFYYNHKVYYWKAVGNQWYFKTVAANAWATTTDPRGGGVITTPASQTFTITTTTNATSSGTGGGSACYEMFTPSMTQAAYGSVQLFPLSSSLAAYGSLMLSNPCGGTIYIHDPSHTALPISYPLDGAPINAISMFVTPERMIVALGAMNIPASFAFSGVLPTPSTPVSLGPIAFTGSALTVSWCDQTDFTQWNSVTANTAETGRTLVGGDYFVGGIVVRDGISLIFTNRCTFSMSYTGNALVYDTPLLANNAGCISPNAMCSTGGMAYWMSDHELWSWNGSVVALGSDDVRDYLFTNLNQAVQYKCLAGVNRKKKQIKFWYPALAQTENSNYLIFQLDTQVFSMGNISRTAWVDSELYLTPFGADVNGIYFEESGTDANGAPLDASITFSPIDLSNGDMNIDFMGFIQDFERLTGNINLLVNTRYYPQDPNTVSGPYTITANDTTPRIDLRCDGKMIGWKLDSDVLGGDFRMGLSRVQIQPSGARN